MSENTKTTFEVTKQQNATLRWLSKATASVKDGRPVLQCIGFVKDALVTCDGFRLFAAKRNGARW